MTGTNFSNGRDPSTRWTVIGATGAVGREVLQILESRGIPASALRVAASERSIGSVLSYSGLPLKLQDPLALSWEPRDIAILAADAATAHVLAPRIFAGGGTVIDNSSAFRMAPGVPLVVPEVNPEKLPRSRHGAIIANPNCSTILLLVALEPLRRLWGVSKIVVSTYQAVSGAGLSAMHELQEQTRAVLAGEDSQPQVFQEPCAFNLFSHDSAVDLKSGLNGEERKIIDEARKIWDDPALQIVPTCIRVPVLRAHTQSVRITLQRPATLRQVQNSFIAAPGIQVIDDRAANSFPTPQRATGRDDVLVGRLRPAAAQDVDDVTPVLDFCLLLSGDQLRKGAALNAVQIAEALLAAATLVVADHLPRESIEPFPSLESRVHACNTLGQKETRPTRTAPGESVAHSVSGSITL